MSDQQLNQIYQLYKTCKQSNILFNQDQSPPSDDTSEKNELPPRKDCNYHLLVQNSLLLFDKLSKDEQSSIIDKSRKLFNQTYKNHGEFLDRSNLPERFEEFVKFLPKTSLEVHTGLLLLAKALIETPDELKGINPPGTFIKYQFMDIIVPINKHNNGHTYQLDLPIMKQSLSETDFTFKRFPSDPTKTTDSKMTCDAQFVRLPDFWEIVAFVCFPENNHVIHV